MNRVLILGGDGYCGWPTALHLSHLGYDIAIFDSFVRRQWDHMYNIHSLTPVYPIDQRIQAWKKLTNRQIQLFKGDLLDYDELVYAINTFRPDAVVHFAEQRSAPFSMIDRKCAVMTQHNNVIGTLNLLYAINENIPDCHLIKLGTMGEYGTPNIDIEEGYLHVTHNGRSDKMLYPKKPGSFYHLSKVHDSHNIEFACRTWGLSATDLNQGVVYGIETDECKLDEQLVNRFDYDEIFGTVLNRFCVQAVSKHNLTVYGKGNQKRGFIDIRDTIRCIRLAVDNPPVAGEFRVFNQFTQQFSVLELAEKVKQVAQEMGINVDIDHLVNPRVELESHYYNANNSSLLSLGLMPYYLSKDLLKSMMQYAFKYHDQIDKTRINPTVFWK